jgi:hypothetical protein
MLKWKIWGIIGAGFAFLLTLLKLKNAKIENLEEKTHGLEKKITIKEEIAEAQEVHQQEEQEAIDKIDDSGWRDNI